MKIFIGIPNLGDINNNLAEQLLSITNKSKHEFEYCFNKAQPTDMNRNIIVDKFLKSDCEYLWFIDSDMLVPIDILDILKNDKKIISPINLIWQGGLKTNIFKLVDNKIISEPIPDSPELIEVWNSGCGCIFLHRDIFEDINKPYFEFVMDKKGTQCNSENIIFLLKAKHKIYIDPKYITGHIKSLDLQTVNLENYKWFNRGKQENDKICNRNETGNNKDVSDNKEL